MDHEQQAREMLARHGVLYGDGIVQELAALIARDEMMRDALENWRDAFLPLPAMRNSFDYELKLTDAALAPIAAEPALPEPSSFTYAQMISYGRLCWAVSRVTDPSMTEPLPAVGTVEEMDEARRSVAAPPAQPAFDSSAKCSPLMTECPRCRNPHHSCDSIPTQPAPVAQPSRSQRMRDAGFTRRPTWRSLPKDGDDEESAPVAPPAPPCPRGLPEREEPERGAFEAWLNPGGHAGNVSPWVEPGRYAKDTHQLAWLAWLAARTAGRREGVRSVQEQTAVIVRAALELLESVEGSEPFTAEKMRAFKRIFGAEDVRAIRTLPDAQG